MSNGGSASEDGTPINLNRVVYGKGLGTVPPSEIVYALDGQYGSFITDIGVDDVAGDLGSATFEIWVDGIKRYESGTMRGASATQRVNIDVSGRGELRLVTTTAGDGQAYDHTDWAGARLTPLTTTTTSTKAPTATTTTTSTKAPTATTTTTPTTAPPATTTTMPSGQSNSANRMLWWLPSLTNEATVSCANMTDAQMDHLKNKMGAGGFICGTRYLDGLGGQAWSKNPNSPIVNSDPRYTRQKALRDSNFVARAKARGLKTYLGFYAVNAQACQAPNDYNWCVANATPYKPWFDDAGWRDVVIPAIRNITAAGNAMGFDGMTIDQENYACALMVSGGVPAGQPKCPDSVWGNAGPGASGNVAAKVRQRGREVMSAMLAEFPSLEITFYFNAIPNSHAASIYCKSTGQAYFCDDNSAGGNHMAFWDGMTSIEGYSAIHYQDASFYKGPPVGAQLTDALAYNQNRVLAYLSRRLSNWTYAASRFSVSPFIWIDDHCVSEGTTTYNRTASYLNDQLRAARDWGMGGQISIYTWGTNIKKDYSAYVSDYPQNCSGTYYSSAPQNYLPSLQATAKPGVVDSQAPGLTVTTPATSSISTSASSINLAGIATDNRAVRFIKWRSDRSGEGAAQMTLQCTQKTTDAVTPCSTAYKQGGFAAAYDLQANWTATVPLCKGTNTLTLTATDIKGLTTTRTLTVSSANGAASCGS